MLTLFSLFLVSQPLQPITCCQCSLFDNHFMFTNCCRHSVERNYRRKLTCLDWKPCQSVEKSILELWKVLVEMIFTFPDWKSMVSREFLSFQLVDEESNIKPTYSSDEKNNALASHYAPPKLSQGSVKLSPALFDGFCCPTNGCILPVMSNLVYWKLPFDKSARHYARDRDWDKTVFPQRAWSNIYICVTKPAKLWANANFTNLSSREALSMPCTWNRMCLLPELRE